LKKTFQKQSSTHFDPMEHTSESFTLVFTQGSQDFGFVAKMFRSTNVISFEIIQFQTLEITNSYNKKSGKMLQSFNYLTFMRRDGWWWEIFFFESVIGWRLSISLMKFGL